MGWGMLAPWPHGRKGPAGLRRPKENGLTPGLQTHRSAGRAGSEGRREPRDLGNAACLKARALHCPPQPAAAVQAHGPSARQLPDFILSQVPNPDFCVSLLIFKHCQLPEKKSKYCADQTYTLPAYSQCTNLDSSTAPN